MSDPTDEQIQEEMYQREMYRVRQGEEEYEAAFWEAWEWFCSLFRGNDHAD